MLIWNLYSPFRFLGSSGLVWDWLRTRRRQRHLLAILFALILGLSPSPNCHGRVAFFMLLSLCANDMMPLWYIVEWKFMYTGHYRSSWNQFDIIRLSLFITNLVNLRARISRFSHFCYIKPQGLLSLSCRSVRRYLGASYIYITLLIAHAVVEFQWKSESITILGNFGSIHIIITPFLKK